MPKNGHFGAGTDSAASAQSYSENFETFTVKEFQILMLLAQNKGHVFSKEQIYNIVWQELYSGDYNIVMSHIHNIREKIEVNPSEPVYIQTVWLETR